MSSKRIGIATSIALLASLASFWMGAPQAALAVQNTVSMPINTAYCENQTGGPLEGCTPWDGVSISVQFDDGAIETCATVSPGGPNARAASCSIEVPFGQTVSVSIDPSQIPAGYVLNQGNPQSITVPDMPPDGVWGVPVFTLDLAAAPEPTVAADTIGLPVQTGFCENQTGGPFFGCTPWDGVEVFYEFSDGSTASCVTESTGAPEARVANCAIDVPFGTIATVSFDESQIPSGYVLNQDNPQVVSAPDGPPDGVWSGAIFTLDLADSAEPTETDTTEPTTVDYRLAKLYSGSCAGGLNQVIADLNALTLAQGEQVGQATAVESETSDTTLGIGLDGIIDGPSAIVVYLGEDVDSGIIACGDIGGRNDGDGELVVTLHSVDGSGYIGIARLAYNLGDPSLTDISIYLADN